MAQSKKVYQESQEFDPWSYFEEEDNFEPIKPKAKKVKKMKREKTFSERKRK